MAVEKVSGNRLPPRQALPAAQDAALKKQADAEKAARIRGVASIAAMRDAIRQASARLPPFTSVPRLARLDAAGFRARAAAGMPFLVEGIARRWPLVDLAPHDLRARFGHLPVRARVGDYVHTAFAPDRAMQDMLLRDYLDLAPPDAASDLPPYVGNLALRELNRLCHWPTWFEKMGPPRFWIGPARTVTPLHCDYDDNLFAQLWGRKRIFLAPPHHDEFLYPREANPLLFGSPVDPEAPDFERFPLVRQAALVELIVEPGDMLYVPAGWYHQVRALSFSLSSNRWARGQPLALGA
ncbi:cupin-like domain-containing protein [Telluria beijingensis]|uniref:cupin-like domain-containing protein n=1 Tax=Telluria beijingensis TaxID=3068633 RepID=UPI0027952818|nr:cupin-like domain-containing protein [Massilia sp. REN29]